jgi:hypothetical protein
MADGKLTVVKNDFSGGQIDPTAKRRDDTELVRSGCRTALNMRLIAGGGATYRPGRTRELSYPNAARRRVMMARPTPSLTFRLVFQAGVVNIYRSDRTLHTSLTIADITLERLPSLRFCEVERMVYVVHATMRPRVLTYDPVADTWTAAPLTFLTDLNNETRQPYFRFASDGVTMKPSATTGDITVEFSSPTLLPGHVGVIFRYVNREMIITAVTDPTHANATVIDELCPTWIVPMKSTRGFSVGDLVEGLDSGVKGEVTVKTADELYVVLYESYDGFLFDEDVVGPHGRQKTSDGGGEHAGQYAEEPGAALRWEEAFMSDERGWPGAVNYDIKRVIFSDFSQRPEAIVWSEISYPDAFAVTGESAGGLFELVPNNCRVVDVVGGSDQFVLTDRGIFFIPISESNPLTPGSVAFRLIDASGASAVSAALMSEGVIFIDELQTRIMAIVPTGQTAKPYLVRDLTEYHSRLLRAPEGLAATKGSVLAPERYVYVRNADGSLVVGKFDLSREWVGWTPWTGVGMVRDMSGSQDDLTLLVDYKNAFTLVEALSPSSLCDAEMPGSDRDAVAQFAGQTVSVFDEVRYRGQFPVNGAGTLVGYSGDQDLTTVGLDFPAELDPLIANVQGGEADGRRQTKRRVARTAVHVIDSNGFECGGRLIAPYDFSDDGAAAAPLREKTYRFRRLGRSDDAASLIRRRWPGRLTVLEATLEVTV